MRPTCLFCGSLATLASNCPHCGEHVYDRDDPSDRVLVESAEGLARQSAIRGDLLMQVWFGLLVGSTAVVGPAVLVMPPVLAVTAAVVARAVYRSKRRAPRALA